MASIIAQQYYIILIIFIFIWQLHLNIAESDVANDNTNINDLEEDNDDKIGDNNKNKVSYTFNDLKNIRELIGDTMLRYIDNTVDPCDDFYEYACGNTFEQHIEKGYEGQVEFGNVMSMYTDIYVGYILTDKDLLETYKKSKLYPGLMKARNYYETCMKRNILENEPVYVYAQFLKSYVGFPAIDRKWSANKFSLGSATGFCNIFSNQCLFNLNSPQKMEPLIAFGVTSSMTLISFSLQTKYYHKEKKIMEYLLKLYDVKPDKVKNIINNIMEFGQKLLKKYDGKNSIEEIDSESENLFNWVDYSRALFFGANFTTKNLEGSKYTNFSKAFVEDDLETIFNYLSLKILYILHSEKALNQNDLELDCLHNTRDIYSFIIAQIYRNEFQQEEDEEDLKRIYHSLKQVQLDKIQDMESFSEMKKAEFIQDVEDIIFYAGYTDNPLVTKATKFIESWGFTEDFYSSNIKRYVLKNFLENFHYKFDETTPLGDLDPLVVTAHIRLDKKYIYMSAATLSAPLYHRHFPKSIVYAFVGDILGHEISHLYGRFYVEDDQKQCFVDQYSTIYVPEVQMTVNGEQTFQEDIADMGGLVLAYNAYKNISHNMSYSELMQEIIPKTGWNNLQTFFVARAQKYCTTYFREHLLLRMYLDEHGLNNFRINVPLQNFPEFSEVFNCPIGSKMNPINKCRVF